MIYVASKTAWAGMWRHYRAEGYPICSTWIDEAGEGQTASFSDLWKRCINEAKTATVLVLYIVADDAPLKGALVEVGAALALNVPVYVVGIPPGSWAAHPAVRIFATIQEAMEAAKRLT